MFPFLNNRVLITGGTGSLGKNLVRRIATGELGLPQEIVIFSRDEAKQHAMSLSLKDLDTKITFRIGDIRDPNDVCSVLHGMDVVINAAALKQVPTCEYHPFDAVRTNVIGAENIVRAIESMDVLCRPEMVIGVSTDKACKPVNAMGMSKALQERVFLHEGNRRCGNVKFMAVRYGNVIASRGSVLPLFHDQIKRNQPITVTTEDMTRFLLTLDEAIDTVFAAMVGGNRGELFVPIVPSARIVDLARAAHKVWAEPKHTCHLLFSGIRPGEKIHEILLSEEEVPRTVFRMVNGKGFYVIRPSVELENTTTLMGDRCNPELVEYSSGNSCTLTDEGLSDLIRSVDFNAAS